MLHVKQPDQTREKILHAAFQEIYRCGFQAASVSNILADTGLTKGALYHHFPTKNDLGLAVVSEVIRVRLEKMIFKPLRASARPAQALLQVIHDRARRTSQESVALGCPLNNLMQEMSPLDEQFRGQLMSVHKAWRNAVADALHRAQRQGEVRADVDCEAAALFIFSSWEGCIGVAKNLQSVKAYRSCMEQLSDYVRGLMERPRRKPPPAG